MMTTTTTKSMNMTIMPIMMMTMMIETISNRTGKEGVYESLWYGTYTL